MIEKTYTVSGQISGQHAKTGELIYWEREVYARNGTSCVVKSYINLNMHVIASFSSRQEAESFEGFRIEAITPASDKQEGVANTFVDTLLGGRFFKVL